MLQNRLGRPRGRAPALRLHKRLRADRRARAGADQMKLALTRQECADALGVSLRTFARTIQPELPVVRRGSILLVPRGSVELWLAETASRVSDDLAVNDEGRSSQKP